MEPSKSHNSFYLFCFCFAFLLLPIYGDAQVRGGYTTYPEIFRTAEKINGTYIPQNIKDAVKCLDKILDEEDKAEFGICEDDILGENERWLRNYWHFWQNSRIACYIRDITGIWMPEDMSGIIVEAYHSWRAHKGIGLKKIKERYRKNLPNPERKKRMEEMENMGLDAYWGEKERRERDALIRKRHPEPGLEEGAKLYYIFPFGCSTKEEERILQETGSYENIAEGVITEIQYFPKRMKVKLTKSTSKYGIIIFDGNGMFDNLHNNRNFKQLKLKNRNIYLLKVGNEFWFPFKECWKPYK